MPKLRVFLVGPSIGNEQTKQKRRKLLTEEFSIRGGRSCVRRLRRILFSSRILVAPDFDVIIIEKNQKGK